MGGGGGEELEGNLPKYHNTLSLGGEERRVFLLFKYIFKFFYNNISHLRVLK